MRTTWNDALFDELRTQGDPAADGVVEVLHTERDLAEVQRVLAALVANDAPVSADLPEVVRNYFEDDRGAEPGELAEAAVGERFFALHGPEIMLALCCNSLPFDYANARGVQVLYQTGFLAKRPNLRVAQTAQMLLDVLTPGGLGPKGRGIRSAQKVRLMHATIRRLILTDPKLGWDREALGVPINQSDLLYTLMSFTEIVLDGLRKLELHVEPAHARAYLDTWRIVGRLMGIRRDVIPTTLDEAAELTRRLRQRDQASSMAGNVMTESLAGLIGDVLGPLRCFRWSLIRFFAGPELANLLGVPRRRALDWVVGVVRWIAVWLDGLVGRSTSGRRVFRWLSLRLIEHFIERAAGGQARTFRIPTQLHEDWKVRAAANPPSVAGT